MKISMQNFNLNVMRHLLVLISLCFFTMSFAQQQPKGPRGGQMPNFEKYMNDRIDFVVQKMQLSPSDSVKFVPLYKEKLMAKGDLMIKSRPSFIKPDQEYPDSVYLNAVNRELNYQVEDARIDQEFSKKFEKILTPKQLFIYQQAEKMFIGSFMHRNGPGRGKRGEQKK